MNENESTYNLSLLDQSMQAWQCSRGLRIEGYFKRYGLKLKSIRYRDLLAYPLTGGYSRPRMLPTGFLRALLYAERPLPQFIMRRVGLRMIIVIEKKPPSVESGVSETYDTE